MTIDVPKPCRHELRRQPTVLWSPCRFVGAPIAIGFCILLIVGCAKNPAKPLPPAVNSDAPNANARIVSQHTFGVADKRSLIWQLESADELLHFYRGMYDGQWSVGLLDATGSLNWHVQTNFYQRGIVALAPTSPLPGGAIAVGMSDVDGDGASETGYATLFTSAGAIASQVLFSSDSSDVWLNNIAPLSDSEFVVVGGERTASRVNPLVATVVVTAAGALEKRHEIVITSITGRYANRVATDPAEASGPERRIYLSTRAEVGTNTITLHGVDLAVPALTPWAVAWNQTLPGKGLQTLEYELQVFSGALYVAGTAEDPDKPTPSTGGYWDSGLAARLSLDGVVEWAKIMNVTGHRDAFFAIEPSGTAVMAIGLAGSYMKTDTREVFGYGWVANLSPAAGALQSSFTFGDPASSSGFECGHLLGEVMLAGGYAQQETADGSPRAWLCTLDLSASSSAIPAVAPEPARPGEVAVPVDRERDRRR